MEKPKHSVEGQATLSREMNLLQITAIGIGAMIGAGIFILTGIAAGQAGPALILVFALNGIIAVIVGACYAELASAMPRTGGPYYWLKAAIGPRWGFYAGWMSWFANTLACSLYALGFGAFAAKLLEVCCGSILPASQQHSLGIAIIIMLVFLFVNYRGADEAGWASTGSALNATLYSASRVSFAMGRGRDLPAFLARITPLRRTPHLAITATGVLSITMLLLLPLREVAASTSLKFLLLFALVCYSLIRLRHKQPDLKRPFRLPLVPLLPWAGVVSCVGLSFALMDLSLLAWVTASIWIVIGVVVNHRMSGKQ